MRCIIVRRVLRRGARLAVLAAIGVPASAGAQVQPFAAAGLAIPAGGVAAPMPALPDGDAGMGYQVDGGIALGFSRGAVDLRIFGTYVGGMTRDFEQRNREFANAGVDVRLDGSARVIGGGLGVAYYFPNELLSNVYPYVVATGGLYQQRHTTEYSGADVAPGTQDEELTITRFGGGGGAGLVWAPGRIRFFLESRVLAFVSSGDRRGYLVPVQFGVKFGPP